MILSCYKLDPRFYFVRKCLSSAFEMHRTVMSVFPMTDSSIPRKDMGILYRVISDGRITKLYVSSNEIPIREMPEGFLPLAGSPKDITGILKFLTKDGLFHFNIRVMPSKKVDKPDSKNSKRVYIKDYAQREIWLKRKAHENGFEVLSYNEEDDSLDRLKNGEYRSVVFKGLLKIIDSEKFINAYKNGIGAEKAFGCGLLLLSKPS